MNKKNNDGNICYIMNLQQTFHNNKWWLAQQEHTLFNIIQLFTVGEVDMKYYWTVNFILTGAKQMSIWIVYCSITLHNHQNKGLQLFYHIFKKYRSVICQISVDVTSQTIQHYDVISQTMRHHIVWPHHPCNIKASGHKPCDINTCLLHVISF